MIRLAHPVALVLLVVPVLILVLGRRRPVVHLLPALAGALVALAVAAPQLRVTDGQVDLTFLVDRSPSVASTTESNVAADAVNSVLAANPDRRQQATVAFAAEATVLGASLRETPSSDLGAKTDLFQAVRLGLATLSPRGGGELVLLSDGRITDGLDEGVAAAVQAGVPIYTAALGRPALDDASLVRLDVPADVETGRPFTLAAVVRSEDVASATLALYRDGALLWTQDVSLSAGLTSFRLSESLPTSGPHTYRLLVRRSGDPFPENDALSALVTTREHPDLLLVSSETPATIEPLLRTLGRNFTATSSLPSLSELSAYREVILTQKHLGELTQDDVEALRSFVSDLGGGLVVCQGEEDLRGSAARRVEDLLPVSYTVPQQGQEASLAVVYLLDHSGSMAGTSIGASKLDLLKEATAASVSLLDAQTLVGVIGFTRDLEELIPLQPLGDGKGVYESLASLDANGGTDLYYPIVDALDLLAGIRARVKHVILFSDGKTADEYRDFAGLAERLQKGDVTLTAIAIGLDPNLPLLTTLAQAGHGSVYPARDLNALPRVSVEATQRLSQSRFSRESVPLSGPLASGDLAEIPPLAGHVVTYAKPTAETLLSAGGDPVVARWRIGLGQVAVVNADLAGVWSADWLSWSRGALLLDAILASAEPAGPVTGGLSASVDVSDASLVARVDARDASGGFVNFLDLVGTILPGGATAALNQVAPGLYEASFPTPAEGAYALRVSDRTRGASTVVPFSVPYSAEYRATGVDEDALRRIAAATGGRYLADEVLPPAGPERLTARYADLHASFLLASLGLFFLDLVLRKVPRRVRPGLAPPV